MADYATDLLGDRRSGTTAKKPSAVDYASDLISGNGAEKLPLSDNPASFSTLSKAALVDNPDDKIRIFAQARFPNNPQAISRYKNLDGEIVFTGDDGNLHKEQPEGFSGFMKNLGAATIGKSLPIGGAVVGGITGSAGGPFGAIAGGMAGAGGGEGWRKTLANQLLGEQQSVRGNVGAIGKEMAFAGAGEVLGVGGAKGLESMRLARDFKNFDPTKANATIALGQKYGIDLNPAQATNLTSLKSRHDLLANNPYSSDIIEEGLQKQAEQANKAGYKFLDDVTDIKSARIAGAKGKEAAAEIIASIRKERSEKAGPFYKKAFSYPIGDTSEIMALANRPSMREALTVAKKLAEDEGLDLGDPLNTAQGLHFVKMAFDKMLKEPPRSGIESFSRKSVADMRAKVYDFLNKNTEGNYGAANRVFSAWSTDFDRVGEGIISGVADVKDRALNKAARILLSPDVDPGDVAFARRLFVKNNRIDEWDALLRSYMQDIFEQSGREFATSGGIKSQAPRFRAQMIGNPRQAANLKNAMSLEQWDNFSQLMEVFEALGRTQGRGGSQTYARGAEEAAMRRESGAGALGQTAQTVLSPQTIGTRTAQLLADVRSGKYAAEMAKIMTSPGAMKKIRQLQKMSPNDEKFIAGVSALLGTSGGQTLQ